MSRSEEARLVLLSIGRSPGAVIAAMRETIGLSDFVLGELVGRTAQTVRRWRRSDAADDIPDSAIASIDDLRTIIGMLLAADYDGKSIKRFLQSRNTGLGQERPLDALRPGLGGFREVERVTECFIAGIAPDSGSALSEADGADFEPASPQTPPEPLHPLPEPIRGRS